jgi:hypothetical protein
MNLAIDLAEDQAISHPGPSTFRPCKNLQSRRKLRMSPSPGSGREPEQPGIA